eukprot:NODE_5880_length_483_cov_1.829493_g4417_i0.p1 GENE.NODE_5880_length_483_cov_1.829493_g4417_i0~~NODE_5880_length_483_cov_1.829493_g4417_i0.p1  ORF type:complete len:128 (-),score=18.17 NODE_5880_length_483_cov_1.829493_g4417_i0:98-481(-)
MDPQEVQLFVADGDPVPRLLGGNLDRYAFVLRPLVHRAGNANQRLFENALLDAKRYAIVGELFRLRDTGNTHAWSVERPLHAEHLLQLSALDFRPGNLQARHSSGHYSAYLNAALRCKAPAGRVHSG